MASTVTDLAKAAKVAAANQAASHAAAKATSAAIAVKRATAPDTWAARAGTTAPGATASQ